MPKEEQIRRNTVLQTRLKRYNVEKWANDFMKALSKAKENQPAFKAILISEKVEEEILERFRKSKKRIFFLDYDGTLVNFADKPNQAWPDQELMELIKNVSELNNTKVVLISGRDKESLGSWWKNLSVDLVAEHGVWLKKAGKNWQLNEKVQNDWMEMVRPVVETFCDRTPGTFLEEKNYSLAWHYRKADPDLGEIRANELSNVLKELISNHGLSVLQGNKVLEIKSSGVNKGKAAGKFLINKSFEFIFAMGDDWTDEILFQELPDNAVTVKVGLKKTVATYYVENPERVRNLLKRFAKELNPI
jgi:trehalose 6-phosphate synthase/phosphatase